MASLSDQVKWDEDEAAYLATMQLVSHHVLAMAVKAAIELDVFNILVRGGADSELCASEIAAQIPGCVDPTAVASRLNRVLRFLASHAILRCSTIADNCGIKHKYALEPRYHLLAKNHDGASLAPVILSTRDKDWLDCWNYLKDAVLEDIDPFSKANGLKFFEYLAKKNTKLGGLFNQYMESVARLTTEKIIDAYKGFKDLSELVDVGGGTGTMLGIIISKYPHIKGINFDQPHIILSAPIVSGVEHVEGDFFISVPSGNAILLKWILHDWSDEKCLQILTNCWKALPISGKAIIVEHILPEIPKRNDAVRDTYYLDLILMVSQHHGRERDAEEFKALAAKAGFAEFKLVCHAMNFYVMEFIK